jgi:hypothetical protein
MSEDTVPIEIIENKIYLMRGQKVILDRDLSVLYGIETKQLKRAVYRNRDRFPQDFMFQLNKAEHENLRCQNGTSSWGGRRYLPLAFTEQGVAMLSSVLKSKRAVQVNIMIMRAFVKLRQILSTHKELAIKLTELERKYERHDVDIRQIFDAIKQLMKPPVSSGRKYGFRSGKDV